MKCYAYISVALVKRVELSLGGEIHNYINDDDGGGGGGDNDDDGDDGGGGGDDDDDDDGDGGDDDDDFHPYLWSILVPLHISDHSNSCCICGRSLHICFFLQIVFFVPFAYFWSITEANLSAN